MKKTVFLMGVAALTLASCSQEDVMYVNQKADGNVIAFNARTAKSTRALDITTNSLESFMVFGLKGSIDEAYDGNDTMTDYFGEVVEFKKQEGPIYDANGMLRDYFASDKPYYYPTDGSNISFIAFAPTTLKDKAGWTEDGKFTLTDYTVRNEIDEQEDIIADWVTVWRPSLDDLKDEEWPDLKDNWHMNDLTFEHALTKVFVSGASNSDTRYKYEVAGVKLGNVAKTGSCYGKQADDDAPEDYINKYFYWSVDEDSYGDFTYIFDEPIEIGEERTQLMTNEGEFGSFLMLPQQLKSEILTENPETESVIKLEMKEGVAYVALLLRITYNNTGEVVYPYAEGVEGITVTIDGKDYAWAAFPVASKWDVQRFVDYYVEFGNGAGYVAPGADEMLEYTPILGPQIYFFEDVWSWDKDGNENTVGQGYEGVSNVSYTEDPFLEDD